MRDQVYSGYVVPLKSFSSIKFSPVDTEQHLRHCWRLYKLYCMKNELTGCHLIDCALLASSSQQVSAERCAVVFGRRLVNMQPVVDTGKLFGQELRERIAQFVYLFCETSAFGELSGTDMDQVVIEEALKDKNGEPKVDMKAAMTYEDAVSTMPRVVFGYSMDMQPAQPIEYEYDEKKQQATKPTALAEEEDYDIDEDEDYLSSDDDDDDEEETSDEEEGDEELEEESESDEDELKAEVKDIVADAKKHDMLTAKCMDTLAEFKIETA